MPYGRLLAECWCRLEACPGRYVSATERFALTFRSDRGIGPAGDNFHLTVAVRSVD
jgi:hypothetical protein